MTQDRRRDASPSPDRPSLPAGLPWLSAGEAAARLARFGPNQLVQAPRFAAARELLGMLLDPMALMLVAAAIVYLVLGETRDGVVMLVALVPVLGVDVVLEMRSRAALRALATSVASRAAVVRDGAILIVEAVALVPGDIAVLREGDVLHADGVVRWAANLSVDESSLTGESEPQVKRAGDASLDDAQFFAGGVVLTGHGFGELTETGPRTRYAQIARLVAEAETSPTPLQRKTSRLVRQLGVVAFGVALAVFALQLARGGAWSNALIAALSLAMASIPEEFPLVFTLFLSIGAWRLGRRRVLVRRLASVETLGSTTVICTDKTGTLTHGEFVLDRHVRLDEAIDDRQMLEAAVLACERHPTDAMDRAIVAYAEARGVDVAGLHARYRLVRDHDFDPVGKHMSHVWQKDAGGLVVAKGALEGVLAHVAIAPEARQRADAANARLADAGMRVLALAARPTDASSPGDRASDEQGLALYGLLAFGDPVRGGVADAVAECQRAGVKIKMITGDHALTAHAVAHAAGIAHEGEDVVTGEEIASLAPERRDERIASAAIFARIDPVQKHAIVDALRRRGEIVAMTGDGVNDAPALRRADIGIAMGRRGTEVARAAADMVLLDDDFVSIVATLREGRHILRKIETAFLYLLAFHVPIVGLALLAPVLGLPLLLLPLHLVWLELIVHPVSAFVFEGEPAPRDLMSRPPRDPKAPLLERGATIRSLAAGAALTAVVLGLFWFGLARGEYVARALALTALLAGYQALALIERVAVAPRDAPFWPRTARFWIIWILSGSSLPLALYAPALSSALAVTPLALGDVASAVAFGVAAVAWRAPLDRLSRRPYSTPR